MISAERPSRLVSFRPRVAEASDGGEQKTSGLLRRGLTFGSWWPWLAIAAFALLIRAAVVVGTPGFVPKIDPVEYDLIAQALASGQGYPPTSYAAPGSPSALRAPAYPLLLTMVYEVFGHSYNAARIASAFLGVVTVMLVGLLGQLVWGRRVGLIASGLAAVFPPLIMLNASLLSEALFLPLVLGALSATLAYGMRGERLWLAAAAGAFCGTAALTRQIGLPLVVLVAGALCFPQSTERSWRKRLVPALTALAACALVVSPWALRNTLAFKEFVPISTQDGPTIAGTYNSEAAIPNRVFAVWRVSLWLPEYRPLVNGTLNEAQINRATRSRALAFAGSHPEYVGAVVGLNTLRLFGVGPAHKPVHRTAYTEMGVPRALWWPVKLSTWLLAGLAAFGIFAARRLATRRGVRPTLLWAVPLVLFISVVWISGSPRFRAPIDAFMVIWAAAGLSCLSASIRQVAPLETGHADAGRRRVDE
jgi:4-amino-4-deoxy-L-arabinose transferase-like glycosyltransferase